MISTIFAISMIGLFAITLTSLRNQMYKQLPKTDMDRATSTKPNSSTERVFQNKIFKEQVVEIQNNDRYIACIFDNVLFDFERTKPLDMGTVEFLMCSFKKVTLPDGRDLVDSVLGPLPQFDEDLDADEEEGWQAD